MPNNFLNVSEFAKLAETTKRTVLWYEEKGILKPKQINPKNGYRLYGVNQIIDFKAILLLRKLSFSLKEIKSLLEKRHSPEELFDLKKKSLKQEIDRLQAAFADTEKYYHNLQRTGTLVEPTIKTFKPRRVFYIDKHGPYREIGNYFDELRSYFDRIPKDTQGLVIYEDMGYHPTNANTKICLLANPSLKLKPEAKKAVREMTTPGFEGLSYVHRGSSKLLSTLWQELKKYRDKKGYKANKDLSFEDIELSPSAHITEMIMPIDRSL